MPDQLHEQPHPASTAARSRVASWTRGLDDGYTQAIELVATIVLFTLAGVWLDGRFETRPVLTIVLAMIAIVGNGAKLYYGYRARIAADSEGKPWAGRT